MQTSWVYIWFLIMQFSHDKILQNTDLARKWDIPKFCNRWICFTAAIWWTTAGINQFLLNTHNMSNLLLDTICDNAIVPPYGQSFSKTEFVVTLWMHVFRSTLKCGKWITTAWRIDRILYSSNVLKVISAQVFTTRTFFMFLINVDTCLS